MRADTTYTYLPGVPPVNFSPPNPHWVRVAHRLAVEHGVLSLVLVLAAFVASDLWSSCERQTGNLTPNKLI